MNQPESFAADPGLEDEQCSTALEEEWVFSIRLPNSVPGVVESISDSSNKSERHVRVELRHVQEPSFAKDSIPRSDSAESMNEINASDERRALLRSGTDPPPQQWSSELQTGWSFTSRYWSVQSNQLLTVTYRPAWQAIPEFTNKKAARCISFCRTCCHCGIDRADYISEVYTVQDVVRVQQVDNLSIPGAGLCKAVKLYLRPMAHEELSSVPLHLEQAFNSHVQRMRKPSSVPTPPPSDSTSPASERLGPILTFALSAAQTDAPLLWKVQLPTLPTPVAIETITVLDGKLCVSNQEKKEMPVSPTHIYINGYQSWSFSGSVVRGQEQPTSAMPDVFSRAFNFGGSPPPPLSTIFASTDQPFSGSKPFQKFYQSDFFTCITSDGNVPNWRTSRRERRFPFQQLDETGGPALIIGWLAQREQFGVITADKYLQRIQMHCSSHGQIMIMGVTAGISTDWAYAQLISPHSYDEEPMASFLHSVAAHNHARPLQNGNLLTGWCSWYVFYERINASILRQNFGKLAGMRRQVPTNVAVVDDGYMTAWGDWDSLKPDSFSTPPGMKGVSDDIGLQRMRPGIWLAPFAADKFSKLAKDHPEWIIRNDDGAVANSSNCGKFFYGLDATNPTVRAHVHEAIRRAVQDWKFNVLKINFLYAACLHGNGKYDLSMSRAQAMHLALKTIRDAAGPEVALIGCGCPIASGIGFVDAMRVSADTGPTWYPALPLPWWDNGTLPALRSMLRNSLARAPFGHRWWHNDPDCIMLGEHTRLTNMEVASAASIVAMTCGMLLLSDDLPKVSRGRMHILEKIFPLTGVPAVVLDLHSTNDSMPSLLRLWCTDKYNLADSFRETAMDSSSDHNAEATFYARKASFSPDAEIPPAIERKRSCVHVAKGLGTWTIISLSNWSDRTAVLHVPPPALLPPPRTGWTEDDNSEDDASFVSTEEDGNRHRLGYHVFAFWSSKYAWLPDQTKAHEQGADQAVSKKLHAHETEIFHIKPVTPDAPQYVGSDLHFTCGYEVRLFHASKNSVQIWLKADYHRAGHVFVFIPRVNTNTIRVTVSGRSSEWQLVGNTPNVKESESPRLAGRVIRIKVHVHADARPHDGQILIEF